MRQWLEAGYFKGDLPISQSQSGPFIALSSLFRDASVAFKPTGPSEEEKAKIAEMKAMAAAKAEAEARVAAARQARAMAEAESARQAELQSNQYQSAQLKMMLGLGGAVSNEVAGAPVQSVSDVTVELEDEFFDENTASQLDEPAPQSKPVKSKSAKKEKAPVPVQVPVPTPTPAWGGAGTNKKQPTKKSMSEIQKEEARVASKLAKQRQSNPQPAGGGWANIAASGGTTAWTGAAVAAAPTVAATSGLSTASAQQVRTKQQMSAAAQKQALSSTQKTLEEFGADDQMSPALEVWCKEQMRKLNGSEDLTLVAFCMTLADPVEIKQYLTAYLGSTPQVNNFATEFINRKNGTKQQEQWETTGSSKKGRKKKAPLENNRGK